MIFLNKDYLKINFLNTKAFFKTLDIAFRNFSITLGKCTDHFMVEALKNFGIFDRILVISVFSWQIAILLFVFIIISVFTFKSIFNF